MLEVYINGVLRSNGSAELVSVSRNPSFSISVQGNVASSAVMKQANHGNKEGAAKLLRFASTYNDSDKQDVTLEA